LSAAELDTLIGDRDYKLFLNSRNEVYRQRDLKNNPPSRAEVIRMMAAEPNLIRRPLVIRGKNISLGFDENSLREISK